MYFVNVNDLGSFTMLLKVPMKRNFLLDIKKFCFRATLSNSERKA